LSRTEGLPARFLEKIVLADSGCWEWIGRRTKNGYGRYYIGTSRLDQRYASAHRWAYELLAGPIPNGMDLVHLCRVRHCVNPAHLEPVTRAENISRGFGPSLLAQVNAAKALCVNGHPFDETNSRPRPTGGRACRQCERDRRAALTPVQIAEDLRKGRQRGARQRARRLSAAVVG
jgi:hypothetical protein